MSIESAEETACPPHCRCCRPSEACCDCGEIVPHDPLDLALQAALPRYLTNDGHGHIWARPDGKRMRCGGVRLCDTCKADAAALAEARQKVALGSTDWRAVLKRYMAHVYDQEGTTFVPLHPGDGHLAPPWSAEELHALGQVETELATEGLA